MEADKTETIKFEALDLDPLILDAIRDMGFESPTPIQAQTIPLVLAGTDLIALAETGSGKTAACGIPVCHKVDATQVHIQALVVVPTRELALQYATEIHKIGRFKKVSAFALFGGEDMGMQRAKLKNGVQVMVATPGRLIDFIYARHIDLTHVNTLILDEADQMLGMGFYEDLEFIIQCLNHAHQTLLFSATMPAQIRKIAKNYMLHPKEVSLIQDQATPENISHDFLFCPNQHQKQEQFLKLLLEIEPKQCLIFANSRREVEALHRALKKSVSSIDFLHGGLDQSIRSIITGKFMKGKIRYLIATDVASRGLDFSKVTHVFNYHLPLDQETYLHRAGRTGRSGRTGACVTLITPRDLSKTASLFKLIGKNVKWIGKPPSKPPPPRHQKRRSP